MTLRNIAIAVGVALLVVFVYWLLPAENQDGTGSSEQGFGETGSAELTEGHSFAGEVIREGGDALGAGTYRVRFQAAGGAILRDLDVLFPTGVWDVVEAKSPWLEISSKDPQRVLVGASGFVPVLLQLPPADGKERIVFLDRAGTMKFQVSGAGIDAGIQAGVNLALEHVAGRSIRGPGLVRELPGPGWEGARTAGIAEVERWLSEEAGPLVGDEISVIPVFDWPTSLDLTSRREASLNLLPEGLVLHWEAYPSSLYREGWKDHHYLGEYSFDDAGGVEYSVESGVEYGNRGSVEISPGANLVVLENLGTAAISGRLVPPLGYLCDPGFLRGEVELRKVVRSPAGRAQANVGVQLTEVEADGEFAFVDLLPGEYSLLGKLYCESAIVLYSWHGFLMKEEHVDLGELHTLKDSVLRLEISPIDRDGVIHDMETIWRPGHSLRRTVFLRADDQDYVKEINGYVTVDSRRPLDLIGLPAGGFRFIYHDLGKGDPGLRPGYSYYSRGTQDVEAVIPKDPSLGIEVGVASGTPTRFKFFGIPQDKGSHYSVVILDRRSGARINPGKLPAKVLGGEYSVTVNLPNPEVWIAVYEGRPGVESEGGVFFSGFMTVNAGQDTVKVQCGAPTDGIMGRVESDGGQEELRVAMVNLVGIGDEDFPVPLPVKAVVDEKGNFRLPGLPQGSRFTALDPRFAVQLVEGSLVLKPL